MTILFKRFYRADAARTSSQGRSGLVQRDYFVAEDAAGARYWIYRERDDEHARWHLHGLYA